MSSNDSTDSKVASSEVTTMILRRHFLEKTPAMSSKDIGRWEERTRDNTQSQKNGDARKPAFKIPLKSSSKLTGVNHSLGRDLLEKRL